MHVAQVLFFSCSRSSFWGSWRCEGEGSERDDGEDQTWRRPAARQESGEQGEGESGEET